MSQPLKVLLGDKQSVNSAVGIVADNDKENTPNHVNSASVSTSFVKRVESKTADNKVKRKRTISTNGEIEIKAMTEKDVAVFISEYSKKSYDEIESVCLEEEVNGEVLFMMAKEELKEIFKLSFGKVVKLYARLHSNKPSQPPPKKNDSEEIVQADQVNEIVQADQVNEIVKVDQVNETVKADQVNEIVKADQVNDDKETNPIVMEAEKASPVIPDILESIEKLQVSEKKLKTALSKEFDSLRVTAQKLSPAPDSGGKKQVKSWCLEYGECYSKITKPFGMSCVVLGDTGAGKSTLLNSLLGESSLIPTNGMRACTASIVEIRYHSVTEENKGEKYKAEVEFIDREDLFKEIDVLIQDLKMQDGRISKRMPQDPESAAAVAYSKLRAVFGDIQLMGNHEGRYNFWLSEDQCREQLRRVRNHVTAALSTTKMVSHHRARALRKELEFFVDSPQDANELAYWPIVKRVTLWCPAPILKSGVVLVDAPGVRDDNAARDKIVKNYLKDADTIIICSNIRRAVNDKQAKNLLGEGMRRQLMMDGHLNHLIFVATQTDVLNPGEIIDNLDLDDNSTRAECALARNKYTKNRLLKDFYEGIREVQRNSGAKAQTDEELKKNFNLPVFTCSAIDYQIHKELRRDASTVFSNVDETEITLVQKCLSDRALEQRYENFFSQTNSIRLLLRTMSAIVGTENGGKNSEDIRQQVRSCFEKVFDKDFVIMAGQSEKSFVKDIHARIDESIRKKIKEGVYFASNEGVKIVEGWGKIKSRKMSSLYQNDQYATDMHHMTMKATCRRDGVFRNYDWNGDLSEPVYRSLSTNWQRFFATTIPDKLASIANLFEDLVNKSMETMISVLRSMAIDPSQIISLKSSAMQRVRQVTAAKIRELKDKLQSFQRDMSRTIPPVIKDKMSAYYQQGYGERGTGSCARRKNILEQGIAEIKDAMYKDATTPLEQDLIRLESKIKQALTDTITKVREELKSLFNPIMGKLESSMSEPDKKLLRAYIGPSRMALTECLKFFAVENDREWVDPEIELDSKVKEMLELEKMKAEDKNPSNPFENTEVQAVEVGSSSAAKNNNIDVDLEGSKSSLELSKGSIRKLADNPKFPESKIRVQVYNISPKQDGTADLLLSDGEHALKAILGFRMAHMTKSIKSGTILRIDYLDSEDSKELIHKKTKDKKGKRKVKSKLVNTYKFTIIECIILAQKQKIIGHPKRIYPKQNDERAKFNTLQELDSVAGFKGTGASNEPIEL